MKYGLFILVLIGILGCYEKEKNLDVTLIQYENVSNETMNFIADELQNQFKIDTIIHQKLTLPKEAYFKPRNRYKASTLIKIQRENCQTDKIIGITSSDISIKTDEHEDWGIMGLAYTPGKSCVISTHRIKRGIKNENHFKERLTKVVTHEFGHTFGLPHCANDQSCVMRDANGKVSTVDEVNGFCEFCTAKIQQYLKN